MIETIVTTLILGTTTPSTPKNDIVKTDDNAILVEETRGTKPNRLIKIGV